MKFKSIQWRLQVWHGAILLIVLTAFGGTAYQLARENRFRLIDSELERHAQQLAESLAPVPDNPEFLGFLQKLVSEKAHMPTNSGTSSGPTRPSFPGILLDPSIAIANAPIPEQQDCYFVFFKADGSIIRHSKNCPPLVPPPSLDLPNGLSQRTRGIFREHLMISKAGFSALMGRSIQDDLTELRRMGFFMIIIGFAVGLVGLLGGRWLAARAIAPISDISAAVNKITSGNLSQRINLDETDNELGELARALNATFDGLQSAFAQLRIALNRQMQFTADASHELRTPLAVILAEVNSSLARERSPEDYREAMESCRRAAQRMHQLTESLLTLARLDSDAGRMERGNLALDKVVSETLQVLQPLAGEHEVTLHSEIASASFHGNSHQLGQVVTNLVSNAIYYNRPGGKVNVKLENRGATIQLEVRDNGVGISDEDLPNIFERFYRADASRSQANGHAGLGLAISKAIVELHGGTIRAESKLSEGTVFTVDFPQSSCLAV